LTILPISVFANAGSPMMWFGILHSLILNTIIGLYESNFLKKEDLNVRTWLIILGNYFSMIIGFYFIAPIFSSIGGNNDFWGGQTRLGEYEIYGFVIGFIASFIVTLIIEFPFFYYGLKDKNERGKLFWPFLESNLRTNTVLFVIYLLIISSS